MNVSNYTVNMDIQQKKHDNDNFRCIKNDFYNDNVIMRLADIKSYHVF